MRLAQDTIAAAKGGGGGRLSIWRGAEGRAGSYRKLQLKVPDLRPSPPVDGAPTGGETGDK